MEEEVALDPVLLPGYFLDLELPPREPAAAATASIGGLRPIAIEVPPQSAGKGGGSPLLLG